MRKTILTAVLVLLSTLSTFATDILMHTGTETLTAGETVNFYDHGGKYGNYEVWECNTLTVTAPQGKLVQVSFTSFNINKDQYTFLEIYNGANTSAPLLTKHVDSFSDTKTYTANNEDGTLTFFFKGGATPSTGWEATLTTIDKPTEYTLSFSTEHGTAPADIKVYDGIATGSLPKLDATDGHIHTGWAIDGDTITAETTYNYGENKEASALWSKGYLMHTGVVTLSAGESYEFYDSGYKGNYADNENDTLTIYPANGELVQLVISNYDGDASLDFLKIYNGTSASDETLITNYTDDFSEARTHTATNADGALTIVWKSNDGWNFAGWEGTLSSVSIQRYTLSFTTERGTAPADMTVYDDLPIGKLPELGAINGYYHTGWEINGDTITAENIYNYGMDIEATALWMEGHTLSFTTERGTAPADMTVYDDLPIGELPNLGAIDGYLHVGWTIEGDTITAETIYNYEMDKEATALWVKGYTLSFTTERGTAPADMTVYKDIEIGKLPNLGNMDEHFHAGWEINGDTITSETIYSYEMNKEATALWTKGFSMHTGDVTLSSDESYPFYDSGYTSNYADREDYTLTIRPATGYEAVQLIISNYTSENTFDYLRIYNGTSANEDALIVSYKGNDDFTTDSTYIASNADGALTIVWHSDGSTNYAGWEGTLSSVQPTSYTITYNLNEGTNNTSNPSTYTVLSETITLANASRNGYTFDGWYDAATDGNKVTEIAAGSTGNKVLYARWTENTPTDISDATDAAPFTQVENTILFSKSTTVAIYSESGAMLYSSKTSEYALPKTGIYLLRTSEGSFKVIGK